MKTQTLLRFQIINAIKVTAIFLGAIIGLTLVVIGLYHSIMSSLHTNVSVEIDMGNILVFPMAIFGFAIAVIQTPRWLRLASQMGVTRKQQAYSQLLLWLIVAALLVGFNYAWMSILGKPIPFVKELGFSGKMTLSAQIANAGFVLSLVLGAMLLGLTILAWYYFSNQLVFWGGIYALITVIVGTGWTMLKWLAPEDGASAKLTRAIASGSFTRQLDAAHSTPWLMSGLSLGAVVLLAVIDFALIQRIELSVTNNYLARLGESFTKQSSRVIYTAIMLVVIVCAAAAPTIPALPKVSLVVIGLALGSLPWIAERF